MASFTDAQIRAMVPEMSWKFVAENHLALLQDGELRRHIREVSHQRAEEIRAYLLKYTSSANVEAGAEVRRPYVDNPRVGTEVFAGRWRNHEVRIDRADASGDLDDKAKWVITQVLRKGLLTALDYDQARLLDGTIAADDDNGNANERLYTLRWEGVDPDTMENLARAKFTEGVITTLAVRKWSNPASSVTLTGNFYCMLFKCGLANDGSGTVDMLVGQPRYTEIAYDDSGLPNERERIYHWGVPKQNVKAILDAWRALGDGRAAVLNYDQTRKLVDIQLLRRVYTTLTLENFAAADTCSQQERLWIWFGLTQAEMLATPDPVDPLPNGYTITRRPRYNGDGSWDLEIVVRNTVARSIPQYNREEDEGATTTRKEDLGVTDLSTVDTTTAEAGKRVLVQIETMEDCSKSVRKDVTTPKDQDHTDTEDRADYVGTTAVDTVSATPAAAAAAGSGQMAEATSTPTPFGFQTRLTTRTAIDQASSASVERADQTVATEIHSQASAALAPPAAADGQVVESTSRPTEFKDRHRTELTIRTAVDQQASAAETRADQVIETEIHTQAAAPLTVPAPGSGQIVEGQSSPTEFKNRHRTVLTTRTAIDQTQTASIERADETRETTVHTQAAAALIPTPAADGQVVESSSRPTEFADRHRTEETIRSAVNQTATVSEETAHGSQAVEVNTQAAAAAAAVPFTEGSVSRVTNTPTEFRNRTRTQVETRTVSEIRLTGTYEDNDGTVEWIVARNATQATMLTDYAAMTPATQNNATPPVYNEFGRYDYTITKKTPATTITSSPDWTTSDGSYSAGVDERGRAVTIDYAYCLNEASAYAYVDAAASVGTKTERGTFVHRYGPGRWYAQRRGVG